MNRTPITESEERIESKALALCAMRNVELEERNESLRAELSILRAIVRATEERYENAVLDRERAESGIDDEDGVMQ